jgi:hypothetical protein
MTGWKESTLVINGKLISFLQLYTARVGEKKLKVRVEGVFTSPASPPPPSKMDNGAGVAYKS